MTPITYDLLEGPDIAAAADLYVESFPQRVCRWFRNRQQATCFYADLFELMWLVHGPTCFSARQEGRLAGCLILIFPGKTLTGALWGNGFALRAAIHAFTGRYGWSPLLLAHAAASIWQPRPQGIDAPHVYVVAVAPERRGQGIGSTLLSQARAACLPGFRQMWLYAEVDNRRAVDLYHRLGFRIVHSDRTQHTMVWQLQNDARQAAGFKPQDVESGHEG